MMMEGVPNESMAIAQCGLRGIGVTQRVFKSLLHEYNNHEMPISDRVKSIALEQDELFFEWIKNKI